MRKINNEILLYRKKEIKIFRANSFSISELKSFLEENHIAFYINTNGIISIDNTLLFREECIFVKNSMELEKIKGITPNFSGIVYIMEKEFFKEFGFEVLKKDKEKFKLLTLDIFGVFKEKRVDERFYDFQVFFSILDIFKILLNKNEDLIEIPYIKYKDKIVTIIDDNLDKKIKDIVMLLCKELKVSIPTCYKIFKILFRETPKKYIMAKKLNRSCYYLCKRNKPIEEIIKEVGYSQSVYYRNFINYSGYKTRKFRKVGEIDAKNI